MYSKGLGQNQNDKDRICVPRPAPLGKGPGRVSQRGVVGVQVTKWGEKGTWSSPSAAGDMAAQCPCVSRRCWGQQGGSLVLGALSPEG